MRWRQPPHSELLRCVTTSCLLGKLVRKGFSFTLGPRGCSMEKDGRCVPLHLERNSLRVEAHVLQRASRSGFGAAGTAVADEHTDDVDIKECHASSSTDPAAEPPAEVTSTPALVLKTWSSIKELQSRSRELGAPIYGTKDVLFRRLCENEQIAATEEGGIVSGDQDEGVGGGYRTGDTKDPPWSSPTF